MSQTKKTGKDAQKSIEALEELLGVKLPHDQEVTLEIKDLGAGKDDPKGGITSAPISASAAGATIQFNYSTPANSFFNININLRHCW